MQFSKSLQGFLPDGVKSPADLITISDADYQLGISPREEGSTLDFQNGMLVVIPAPAPTSAQLQLKLQQQAMATMQETDMVCLRCYKAGIPFPTEWQSYTNALRSIANGTDTSSTALPVKPAYPAGT